ncbi:MAG: ABC-F family ATP-binding cassette domain-containing protein [Oscillospiraceae bacterium]|nr:ABC-F family ATP-binding cassette domain-containing protein [Oscillospiraceae bacterium]
MVITLEDISKSFGANLILTGVTARIEDNDKIGLVGINGAGKTTLLNIIYGELEADSGIIARGPDVKIGYLRQDSGLSEGGTVDSETRGVFRALLEAEEKLRELEHKIAGEAPGTPASNALTEQYNMLQSEFDAGDGYLIDVKISSVLGGMGFADIPRETPVSVLSGGEKTRLAICKLLLESPALLILDEPTNHLDFKTLSWLEEYLKAYRGALLVVSHDRYFLDKLCGHIWDVFDHQLSAYPGGYSDYVRLRDERFTRRLKEYEIQQQQIADMKDFIARNIVRASTTGRAKSRQKALDRMEPAPKPKLPPRPAVFSFRYQREPVKDVLLVSGLTVSVPEGEGVKTLFEGVDFEMPRGSKIALIGANGIGKTSFIRAVIGQMPHDSGNIEWGRGTEISYFEQGDELLDASKTALGELWDRFPREYEHTIRTKLGHVQITGENIYKKVGELSGGERARVKMAILSLSCGNVLIMDEPTNHLDLASKESLDKALGEYTGTLLIISHDRYLLEKVPGAIAEMGRSGIKVYKGGYNSYLEQKEREAASAEKPVTVSAPKKSAATGRRTKKQRSEEAAGRARISALEKRIEELEAAVWALENEIADPDIASDFIVFREKYTQLEEKRLELGSALGEWSEISGE